MAPVSETRPTAGVAAHRRRLVDGGRRHAQLSTTRRSTVGLLTVDQCGERFKLSILLKIDQVLVELCNRCSGQQPSEWGCHARGRGRRPSLRRLHGRDIASPGARGNSCGRNIVEQALVIGTLGSTLCHQRTGQCGQQRPWHFVDLSWLRSALGDGIRVMIDADDVRHDTTDAVEFSIVTAQSGSGLRILGGHQRFELVPHLGQGMNSGVVDQPSVGQKQVSRRRHATAVGHRAHGGHQRKPARKVGRGHRAQGTD